MSEDVKFSTGRIVLVAADLTETDLGACQDISIHYSSSNKELRAGDYDYPIDIQLGDRSCEVTVKSSNWDIDPASVNYDNAVYSIRIDAGKQGGGSLGTIANCKLTDFKVEQKQDEFVLTDLTFKKLSDLT